MKKYIVDFYCKESKLVIEIDGFSHDPKIDYDAVKIVLKKCIHLLGFSDEAVKKEIDNVMEVICCWIDANPPLPRPSGESN